MTDTNTAVAIYQDTEKHNKTSKLPAIMKGEAGQTDYVAHLTKADILLMIETAKTITKGRRGERNALLIRTLFDSCLRISECLSLRPCDIQPDGEGYLVQVLGKGKNKGKVSVCAVSPQTVAQINILLLREQHRETGCNLRYLPQPGFPTDRGRLPCVWRPAAVYTSGPHRRGSRNPAQRRNLQAVTFRQSPVHSRTTKT